MLKDPKGTKTGGFFWLQTNFEGDKGMFWGMKNTEFKKIYG